VLQYTCEQPAAVLDAHLPVVIWLGALLALVMIWLPWIAGAAHCMFGLPEDCLPRLWLIEISRERGGLNS